ncbi:MAG: T9SS type A sorting domain-containing protein [Rhodothermaceae bacterium]|nr:T9SS type A sorting domain-containing protein [Rhodothermaceae bacterium]
MNILATLPRLALFALVTALPAAAQTVHTWNGGTGDWTEPTNWTPADVPDFGDTAIIESGTATLTADTNIGKLVIDNLAILTGDADFTVTDSLIWNAGGTGFDTFRGTGLVTVAAGATCRMTDETNNFRMSEGRTLVNDGVTIWEGLGLWLGQARFINNGELILAFGETDAFGFVFSSLVDAFTNSATGLIRRTGSGNARYSAGLINDGIIRVENGTFDLHGFNSTGMTGTGSIEVQAGTTFLVSGGNNSLSGDVTGEGTLQMAAGTLTLSGSYDVPVTRFTALSTLNLNGTSSTATLDLAAGELNGSGEFTVTSQLLWSGGDMGGSGTTILGPSIPLAIGGANIGLNDTRTLRVEGETTWTGDADFSNGTEAVFENAGTLTSLGAGERVFLAGTFRNEGFLAHEGGTLRFNSGMDNEGVVSVLDGTLQQSGFNATGGTDTGRYEVLETGRLEFIGGTRTLTESAEVVGNGTVAFLGGSVTNDATWTPGALASVARGGENAVLFIDSAYPAGTGVLNIGLAGPTAGTEYAQLDVTGTATLGGTLRISLVDPFEPAEDDRFLIIPATDGATGMFDTLELPDGLEAFVETSALGAELVIGKPVANEPGLDVPDTFALHAAYPNPFASRATLRYDIAEAGPVRLAVYDLLGREVAVLADSERAAGRYEVLLDGSGLASGVYLVRMIAGADVLQSRRVTLLR